MKFVYYSEMFFVREEEREKCSQYFDRLSVVLSPTLSFNPLLGKKTGEGNGTPLQYSCLENPWTEEPGRLQSMGSLRVRHDWPTSLSLSCIGEGNGNPLQYSCLENPRTGEPGGLPSMGSHRVGHDWSDLAAAAAAAAWYFVDFPQFVSCFPWNYTLWGNHHINDDII